MSWIDTAISEFGRTLGLHELAFNDRSVINLVYEMSGSLYLEKSDSSLLVYLCRDIERPNAVLFSLALELCHWRHNLSYPVNAALYESRRLIFSTLLTEEQVSVPTLGEVIRLLEQLHNQASEGASREG